MASLHRKLFPKNPNTTYTTTTVQTCLYYCNSPKNETAGFCPPACLAICPSTCHYSLAALISPPDPLPQPNTPQLVLHKNLSPLLISMLILLASTFLLITFYVLYTKLYSHHHNQTPHTLRSTDDDPVDHDHAPSVIFHPPWYITTVGLNPSLIDTIAVIKYSKEENSCAVECTDCAVCLAEFEQGEDLRILPKCNHSFHIPCIDTWLHSHTNCPLCRAPVVAPDHLNQAVQSAAPLPTADGTAAAEVRIGVEEMEGTMGRTGSVNGVENKELGGIINNDDDNNVDNINKKGSGSSASSSSQRWGLERGAANLVSRSFSCGANIFSSRYDNNSNNNDDENNTNS